MIFKSALYEWLFVFVLPDLGKTLHFLCGQLGIIAYQALFFNPVHEAVYAVFPEYPQYLRRIFGSDELVLYVSFVSDVVNADTVHEYAGHVYIQS